PGHHDAGEHADPGRHAPMAEQRSAGIGAEPDIERVAERELPGEAGDDVPGLAEIGGEQDHHQHGDDVAVDEKRQRQHDGNEEHERDRGAVRQAEETAARHARPSNPCGRNSSTRMRRAKLKALLSEGSTTKPESASDTPTSRPPSSAPGMLPRPPRMTMMKASSV